jgi:hypothetical protein
VARLACRGICWNEQPRRERLDDHGRAVLNPGAVIRAHQWLELDFDIKAAVRRSA